MSFGVLVGNGAFQNKDLKELYQKNKCCGISGISDPEGKNQIGGKLVSGLFHGF